MDKQAEGAAPIYNEPHALLEALHGEWQGTTRTCFEPNVVVDECQWTGRIAPCSGGRFALHSYSGSMMGKPLEGSAAIGYSSLYKRWEIGWTDSFHTAGGVFYSTGEAFSPGSNSFSVSTTYNDGQGGPDWGWRTEYSLESPSRLAIRHYNIPPGEAEGLAVETLYERV